MPRVSGVSARLATVHETELDSYVAAIDWAPDGCSAAIAADDGTVGTLDLGDGRFRSVTEHPGGAMSVAWGHSGVLASGGRDGRLALDGDTADSGRHWIEQIAWRPDGGLLAVASGRRVEFWTPEGVLRDRSDDFPATVAGLAWHPKGIECAAAGYGGVRLLRANGAAIAQRLDFTGSVLELAFSPDGRRLAHGNQDASVHFWDLRKARELEMTGYATKVRELAWSPNGRWLATGGGSAVTLWDFHRPRGPAGSRPLELDRHTDRVTALAFRPQGDLLASVGRDGLVLLWHPDHDDLPVGGTALDAAISALAWAPDGHHLAIGSADGTVAVLELER